MDIKQDAFEAFEPENDVKAFIYQQVADLEVYMQDLGSLAVLLEKEEPLNNTDPNQEKYAVTFVIAPEQLNIKIRAESKNVFEAARLAKEQAQLKLGTLTRAMHNSESLAEGQWQH